MDTENQARWLGYLGERTGTYEYRTLRYAAVADVLENLGLAVGDMVVDVGAGMCDFDRYLRTTRNFDGRYVPVDGAIDGVDLNEYQPHIQSEFYTAIETLEHLVRPFGLLDDLMKLATKGVVITTPNPVVWGSQFYKMDSTHISPINRWNFEALGWETATYQCFGRNGDTIVAWYDATKAWEQEQYVQLQLAVA